MNMLSLPSVPTAQLPRVYEAAREALTTCQNVDECKDWADKAAALASYAKPSQATQRTGQAPAAASPPSPAKRTSPR